MTRYIFVLITLLYSANTLAQSKFNLKGGLNFNFLAKMNDATTDDKWSIGFNLGGGYEIKLSEKFLITPELQYIQKGFGVEANPLANSDKGRVNLNYIEVPIIFSWKALDRVHIDLGPSGALRVISKGKSEGDSNDVSNLYNKSFEFGVHGGVKINLTEDVYILTRYYHAISPILEFEYNPGPGPSAFNEVEKGSWHNRNIQIAIGYRL